MVSQLFELYSYFGWPVTDTCNLQCSANKCCSCCQEGSRGKWKVSCNKQFFLSTNEQAPVPESTPRRLECACERLNRCRHWWWSKPLACPHTEWPASWHRNPCLVIHPDQVRSWTGKRIGRFEWISGTKKPHFATFQNRSTSRNPASLYINHTKK